MHQRLPDASTRPSEGHFSPSRWFRVAALAVAATALTGTIAAADQFAGSPVPPAAPALAGGEAPAVTEAPAEAAPPAEPPAPVTGPGYRIASTDGGVYAHGWVDFAGSAAGSSASPTVGIAHTPDDEGYWLASADGGVFAFGTAGYFGSAAGASAHRVVDIAATASGLGYWLVAADGGVFAFGDAAWHGAAADAALPPRIVSLAPTASGAGYWLVSSDGGVFSYGDAPFFGSVGDQAVNARVIDLVPSPSGHGYYLVAADGGVFTFGDAVFHGSALDQELKKPVVDMALHPDGSGYWLLSADGGVYSYGEAPFLGAPAAAGAAKPFIAIAAGVGRTAPAPVTEPAPFPAAPVPAPAPAAAAPEAAPAAVGAAAARKAGKGAGKAHKGGKAERALDNEFGWDISYPQCGGPYPEGASTYAIIGVNGGRAFKHNRCLAHQWQWARSRGAAGVYVNVNFPRSSDELARGATSDRQPNCAPEAVSCVAYNFGVNGIRDSLAYAASQGVQVPFIWLDVEQLNYWTTNPELNAVVLRGAIDAVREAGLDVGIYSTPYQFRKLMGDEQPQVPVWTAGADGLGDVAPYCANKGFGGGPAVIVQLLPGQYDPNVACPGAGPLRHYFAMP